MKHEDAAHIVCHATLIGDILERNHPRRTVPGGWGPPAEDAEDIADTITLVVAQILQAWLDAGSERDVTMEELGPHILDHVKGWCIPYDPVR
jgi:hypothetical protein